MGRAENALIFQDTEKQVKKNEVLKSAVDNSTKTQKLILENMLVTDILPDYDKNINRFDKNADIVVSKKRSYEAASTYKYADEEAKVCVHNFASASNPGGGVVNGSSAQEEALCRCSTLYFNLNTADMWNGFYSPHRNAHDPIHNDDCIYTEDVVVFKSDTANPKLLAEKDWYKVNVITCAAPNLREKPSNSMNSGDGNSRIIISDNDLYELHVKRLTRILDVAVATGNDVVILGAFGCGAFRNNPEVVAKASKEVIEKYKRSFKTIEFAVYCSEREPENYITFKKVLGE